MSACGLMLSKRRYREAIRTIEQLQELAITRYKEATANVEETNGVLRDILERGRQ